MSRLVNDTCDKRRARLQTSSRCQQSTSTNKHLPKVSHVSPHKSVLVRSMAKSACSGSALLGIFTRFCQEQNWRSVLAALVEMRGPSCSFSITITCVEDNKDVAGLLHCSHRRESHKMRWVAHLNDTKCNGTSQTRVREYAVSNHHHSHDVVLQVVPVFADHASVSDHQGLNVMLMRLKVPLAARFRFLLGQALQVQDATVVCVGSRSSSAFDLIDDLNRKKFF